MAFHIICSWSTSPGFRRCNVLRDHRRLYKKCQVTCFTPWEGSALIDLRGKKRKIKVKHLFWVPNKWGIFYQCINLNLYDFLQFHIFQGKRYLLIFPNISMFVVFESINLNYVNTCSSHQWENYIKLYIKAISHNSRLEKKSKLNVLLINIEGKNSW